MAAAPSFFDRPSGMVVLTKTRILIALSLAITWWIAHLMPHYSPVIQAEFKSRLEEARQKIPKIKVDWHRSADPRSRYSRAKVALMIEPRPLPHLVPQILHMISVVPPDWRFLFIGSEYSVIGLGRSYAIKHQQVIGKLDLMILPEPWQIDSKEMVYRTLTDIRFYDEFLPGVEWILKYESDSILCANSESNLNDWLDWSWAGAPRTPDDRFSGNGGLSLRRVSAIKRVLGFQERYNDSEAEDEWFGKRLWVLPDERVAAGEEGVLAVEDVFIENPMGYHVRDGGNDLRDSVWKDPENRRKIFEYCPELSMIMNMKLDRERCDGDNKQGGFGLTDAEKAEEEERQRKEEENRVFQEEEEKRKEKEEEDRRKKEDEDLQKYRDELIKPPKTEGKEHADEHENERENEHQGEENYSHQEHHDEVVHSNDRENR